MKLLNNTAGEHQVLPDLPESATSWVCSKYGAFQYPNDSYPYPIPTLNL